MGYLGKCEQLQSILDKNLRLLPLKSRGRSALPVAMADSDFFVIT